MHGGKRCINQAGLYLNFEFGLRHQEIKSTGDLRVLGLYLPKYRMKILFNPQLHL